MRERLNRLVTEALVQQHSFALNPERAREPDSDDIVDALLAELRDPDAKLQEFLSGGDYDITAAWRAAIDVIRGEGEG